MTGNGKLRFLMGMLVVFAVAIFERSQSLPQTTDTAWLSLTPTIDEVNLQPATYEHFTNLTTTLVSLPDADPCARICQWKTHPQHHQYFSSDDDMNALTLYLSKHAYMSLADVTSDLEHPAQITDFAVNRCLSQYQSTRILVIYLTTGFPRERMMKRDLKFLDNLTIPHVILTVGHGNIWKMPVEKRVIDNPYLLRWFGSSQLHAPGDRPGESVFHPRAYPLPLGVTTRYDSYEQLKHLVKVTQPAKKNKLVMVNFSPVGSAKTQYRAPPYQRFCNSTQSSFATCTKGGFFDRRVSARHNGKLVNKYSSKLWARQAPLIYQDWAKHKFTVSPRGQQTDCHRFWETLYLKSIPIVLRSEMYYQNLIQYYFPKDVELPILFVDSWDNVTAAFLEREWEARFKRILQQPWPPRYLTMSHVRDAVERGIKEEVAQRAQKKGTFWKKVDQQLQKHGLWENRTRCYSQDWR